MHNRLLLSALVGAASVSARDIPSNVKNFYDSLKAKGTCSNKLATGFYSKDNGPNTFSYCGDHKDDYNVIYIKGTGSAFADMDVDCDGEQNGRGDDGRCESSGDTQSITSFEWIIKGYNKGIKDLNANVHPYVVFGNEGTKSGWKTFDPEAHGIRPLSVMAVVCNNKLVRTQHPSPLTTLPNTTNFPKRSTASGATKTATTAPSPWSAKPPSRSRPPASAPP
jgi:hypothetical protein